MPHHKKTTYTSKGQALGVATKSATRTGLPMRVYYCKEHQGWEITKRAAPRTRNTQTPDRPTG